jgi:hypothetical protein
MEFSNFTYRYSNEAHNQQFNIQKLGPSGGLSRVESHIVFQFRFLFAFRFGQRRHMKTHFISAVGTFSHATCVLWVVVRFKMSERLSEYLYMFYSRRGLGSAL